MTDPSAKETLLLKELKENLGDVSPQDPATLLRFLRARDLNLPKAEEMLRKHLKWREENEISSILEWTAPPILKEDYPYEICGSDKEGCPLLVVPYGAWDVRRVCEEGMKKDYIKYVDQLFMNVCKEMENAGVTQFNIVLVPDNLAAVRQIGSGSAVDTVLETVRRFIDNHPETLKRAFVIDTPKVFKLIFAVIRPLLHSKTLAKVQISCGSREWRDTLLKYIEVNNLPPRLGGTFKSKFPLLNKPLKGSFVTGNQESSLFHSLDVPPSRKVFVEYDVTLPMNKRLSWAFKTDKWDIGFGILYEGVEIIVPHSRPNSHEKLQSGSILCQQSGKYMLVFDNSFSRWRSKVVKYKVVIREDDQQVQIQEEEERPEENDDLQLQGLQAEGIISLI